MRFYALRNKQTGEYFKGGKKPRLYQRNPMVYAPAYYEKATRTWRPDAMNWEVVEFLVTEVVPGTPLRTVSL